MVLCGAMGLVSYNPLHVSILFCCWGIYTVRKGGGEGRGGAYRVATIVQNKKEATLDALFAGYSGANVSRSLSLRLFATVRREERREGGRGGDKRERELRCRGPT